MPTISLTQALLHHATRAGQRTAVSDDRQLVSRSELVQLVAGAAADLAGTPQTIGISGENSVEWMVAFIAATALGKIVVPIPTFFSREQCVHIAADAGIGLILEAPGVPDTHRGLGPPARPVLLRRESGFSIPNETGGLIIYTSGSTGRPKGVRLCSGQALWSAQALAKASRASAEDRYLSILPLSLLLELICGIIIPVLVGGTVHYDAACAKGPCRWISGRYRKAFPSRAAHDDRDGAPAARPLCCPIAGDRQPTTGNSQVCRGWRCSGSVNAFERSDAARYSSLRRLWP